MTEDVDLDKEIEEFLKENKEFDVEDFESDDSFDAVDCENPKDYRLGGFCPIKIDDILNERYKVVYKLGFGHFSTVWLCWDTKSEDFVAIKIMKSANNYTESALDEIDILKAASKSDYVIKILDHFKHMSPNGIHVCIVTEVLGDNLTTMMNKKSFNIDIVKLIIKDVLYGLTYLHENKVIHTDLKPENILFTQPSSKIIEVMNSFEYVPKESITKENTKYKYKNNNNNLVKICDLGNSCWTYKHWTDNIQTREYQCPEVILNLKYDTSCDIWSLGCILFEIATGEMLFDPSSGNKYSTEEDHLSSMISLFGPIPKEMIKGCKYFNKKGNLKNKDVDNVDLVMLLKGRFGWEESLAKEFTTFLKEIMIFIPDKRPKAKELLNNAFLKGDLSLNKDIMLFKNYLEQIKNVMNKDKLISELNEFQIYLLSFINDQ